jgi:hypothetical protein
MGKKLSFLANFLLGVALVLGSSRSSSCATQDPSSPTATVKTPSTAPAATPGTPAPYHNQPDRLAKRQVAYYESVWGIDALSVKAVEAGVILRFSFHVIDPEKAKTLNDKKLEPYLISPEKGLKLVIPEMEKVGKLRQTSTPEAGKSYWMAFSNSGRQLKRGDRVDIVIGNFHAEGLMIE